MASKVSKGYSDSSRGHEHSTWSSEMTCWHHLYWAPAKAHVAGWEAKVGHSSCFDRSLNATRGSNDLQLRAVDERLQGAQCDLNGDQKDTFLEDIKWSVLEMVQIGRHHTKLIA